MYVLCIAHVQHRLLVPSQVLSCPDALATAEASRALSRAPPMSPPPPFLRAINLCAAPSSSCAGTPSLGTCPPAHVGRCRLPNASFRISKRRFAPKSTHSYTQESHIFTTRGIDMKVNGLGRERLRELDIRSVVANHPPEPCFFASGVSSHHVVVDSAKAVGNVSRIGFSGPLACSSASSSLIELLGLSPSVSLTSIENRRSEVGVVAEDPSQLQRSSVAPV